MPDQDNTKIPSFKYAAYSPAPAQKAPRQAVQLNGPATDVMQQIFGLQAQTAQQQAKDYTDAQGLRDVATNAQFMQIFPMLQAAIQGSNPKVRAVAQGLMQNLQRTMMERMGISPATYAEFGLDKSPGRVTDAMGAEQAAASVRDQAMQNWISAQGLRRGTSTNHGKTGPQDYYYKPSGEFYGTADQVREQAGVAQNPNQGAFAQWRQGDTLLQKQRQDQYNASMDQLIRDGAQWADQASKDSALRAYTGEHFNRLKALGAGGI